VLDKTLSTIVGETLGQAARDAEPPIHLTQKKRAAIGRDVSTVKRNLYLATAKPLEFDLI
jgi:hypothetical protein